MFSQNGHLRRVDCYTLCGKLYEPQQGRYNAAYPWEIEDWDDRWKFTVIRNPFDRLVSSYRFALRPLRSLGNIRFKGTFKEYVRIAVDPQQPMHIYGLPDHPLVRYIKTHTAPLVSEGYYLQFMDFIGRFERYHADVMHIMRELGHPDPENIGHRHNTRLADTPHYSTYYDNETRSLAEQYYWSDCERYDYRFQEAA
jgi:hypothetical protein